jgi:uncharacterized protein (DUF1778 family)
VKVEAIVQPCLSRAAKSQPAGRTNFIVAFAKDDASAVVGRARKIGWRIAHQSIARAKVGLTFLKLAISEVHAPALH